MNSIIELRKKELTAQINQLIINVQFFLSHERLNERSNSISEYIKYNKDILKNVNDRLEQIKSRFNPNSDNYETFDISIKQLKKLQNDIIDIQKRGESKQERLQYISLINISIHILAITIVSIVLYNLFGAYWAWMKETGWGFITLLIIGYIVAVPLGLITEIFTGGLLSGFVKKVCRKIFLED